MNKGIIIKELPQEMVYTDKIYEVFDEDGISKGLFENSSSQLAAHWAYISYFPEFDSTSVG